MRTLPHPLVGGKTVPNGTRPRCQRGWGPLPAQVNPPNQRLSEGLPQTATQGGFQEAAPFAHRRRRSQRGPLVCSRARATGLCTHCKRVVVAAESVQPTLHPFNPSGRQHPNIMAPEVACIREIHAFLLRATRRETLVQTLCNADGWRLRVMSVKDVFGL